jgi:hypothetical protein
MPDWLGEAAVAAFRYKPENHRRTRGMRSPSPCQVKQFAEVIGDLDDHATHSG